MGIPLSSANDALRRRTWLQFGYNVVARSVRRGRRGAAISPSLLPPWQVER